MREEVVTTEDTEKSRKDLGSEISDLRSEI